MQQDRGGVGGVGGGGGGVGGGGFRRPILNRSVWLFLSDISHGNGVTPYVRRL
jgi:hypothetical protein